MSELTHFDSNGAAQMVDVSDKAVTRRVAVAEGWIEMKPETLELIRRGGHKKGDVLGVARIAGIMAAKRTADMIPLCHPLMLTRVRVDLETRTERNGVKCRATVETQERSGVEIEALMAVQTALLTVYDMCKAVDRGMSLNGIRLIRKSGGKSGLWQRDDGDSTG